MQNWGEENRPKPDRKRDRGYNDGGGTESTEKARKSQRRGKIPQRRSSRPEEEGLGVLVKDNQQRVRVILRSEGT